MNSLTNPSPETRRSFTPDRVWISRTAVSISCAAALLTLGGQASAQDPTDNLVVADSAPGAASDPIDPEGEVDAPTQPAAVDAATPQESLATAEQAPSAQAPAQLRGDSADETDSTMEVDSPCDPPISDERPISDDVVATPPLSPLQSRALWPLSWKKSPGQGFSLGMEEGLWGNSWSQGLRVTIPFTRYLGTTLRGIYLIDMSDGPFTADAGGRIDFFGRSSALLNVVRLYGGGGVQVLAPVANTDGRKLRVGVGGHFGFEFFHNPSFSYYLEVGGQGGEPSPGATVVAGMMFYPWTH